MHATWDKRVKESQYKDGDKDIRRFTLHGSDVVYYIKLRYKFEHDLWKHVLKMVCI